jgi:hypothetical protein
MKSRLLVAMTAFPPVFLILAGVLFFFGHDSERECFQYDSTVESYTICGTPNEIVAIQFRRGREFKQSVVNSNARGWEMGDPEALCLTRAATQAEMHDWPPRYLAAYEEGCRA